MSDWFKLLLHVHGRDWLIGVAILAGFILLSRFAHPLLLALAQRFKNLRNAGHPNLQRMIGRIRRPAQALVLITGLGFILPFLDLPKEYLLDAQHTAAVLWFLALGWLMIALVYCAEDFFVLRFDITVADNLRARRARTQLQIVRRMVISMLVVIDIGLALSVFRDSMIWHYGAGLLASAGLASLVLATAAKSSASNLLAGIQIALSEPIRLDDVVVVQNEWGRIEEITSTYVVIAIWDQRRLVVPLSYFIENPIENWTRKASDILGTSFLYVDYSVPVEPLRQHLLKVLEASTQWDKRVCALQVTNLSEHTMELRCLMSARDSSKQFDLRCIVREKMIDFIRENYPEAFPRMRFTEQQQKLQPDSRDDGGAQTRAEARTTQASMDVMEKVGPESGQRETPERN